jgi:hypothetical protein
MPPAPAKTDALAEEDKEKTDLQQPLADGVDSEGGRLRGSALGFALGPSLTHTDLLGCLWVPIWRLTIRTYTTHTDGLTIPYYNKHVSYTY